MNKKLQVTTPQKIDYAPSLEYVESLERSLKAQGNDIILLQTLIVDIVSFLGRCSLASLSNKEAGEMYLRLKTLCEQITKNN